MINHEINRLVQFGLDHQMIEESDVDYSVNLLLDLFGLDSFQKEEIHEFLPEATTILEQMLSYAVNKEIIEDNTTSKDLFDTRIMNCIMPRPSEVIRTFHKLYNISSETATDYYVMMDC